MLASIAPDMIFFPTKAKMAEATGNVIFKLGLPDGDIFCICRIILKFPNTFGKRYEHL